MNPLTELRKRIDRASLRQVAKDLNISAPYLSDIMRERRAPGPKVLQALGVEVEVRTTRTYRKRKNGS